ncbi:hypothetical protein [Methylobacterium soli]|uniref:Uncharacterized protein n=1 Tax=Methylobacterium soli TaxID=553447 RepID=A0A6L3SX87_9HYPH|nr:hypothetical protein [Methylobacterium soli]KAB1078401.1 hypothetical protein F6X53_15055 [Methylobacterium soli]
MDGSYTNGENLGRSAEMQSNVNTVTVALIDQLGQLLAMIILPASAKVADLEKLREFGACRAEVMQ